MRIALPFLVVAAVAPAVLGCASRDRGFNAPAPAIKAEAKQGESDLTFAKMATAPKVDPDQAGLATWYGGSFAGKKTANGERFDPTKYTAAHRRLPFGTWVEVRRADTGRTVRVRVNDRGPFGDDRRVIDLSRKAAEELDIVRDGVAKVELRIVSGP